VTQEETAMKIVAMAAMTVAVMTGAMATNARAFDVKVDQKVAVCMAPGAGLTRTVMAEAITSRMFKKIGLIIKWHATHCPSQGIQITLQFDTPTTQKPGALGYAVLNEGTRIVVFYDRILALYNDRSLPLVLAHVLTHEITHVLEGISRHSDSGLMKAFWSREDINGMGIRPMEFSDEDITLIYNGLAYPSNMLTAAAH
jgi:hypothetical protein